MSWEGFYGQWPAMIVLALGRKLPPGYFAAPRVHLAALVESDAATPDDAAYQVRVYRMRGRRIVAAVEIVSPANKDNPEHRAAFVSKCAALLQQGVSVAVVDLVTTYNSNLYCELLELLGQPDPRFGAESPSLYAAACRAAKNGVTWQLQAWTWHLALGQPLPTLPLWLAADRAVPLELEDTYEETCRALRLI
jgi:hypothetical protein